MRRFDVISIFPEIFQPVFQSSIIKRAQEKKKAAIRLHDLRDYTKDKHRKVDDRPFGGGPGMVMSPQPIFDAVKKIKGRRKARVVLTCAAGKKFDQAMARKLLRARDLIIICGHYEGVDERVREGIVDESISIGDYVLTGGEIPAMVIVDAVVRLIPGVLGKEESLEHESFEHGLLEYPQYTRPADFRGRKVPEVLLSGHHGRIEQWRKRQAEERTKKTRPDLLRP
ncbi:MAG: tRNA (guanosine(37)-N1)-methyltransferase TrmD [Candidatus Omnitrophota bacterium]|nr:tRNA (guanosine(37)-N1)-methyltransferase TrmD [Candidatus Omnitrophota bacterium]MDZ4242964.1 tRNA (guanosine(37)-N1)-methyltransferase TrmD [Candidatus Omnitrophota bacterium]